jgi:type IV secretion system protein VirB9
MVMGLALARAASAQEAAADPPTGAQVPNIPAELIAPVEAASLPAPASNVPASAPAHPNPKPSAKVAAAPMQDAAGQIVFTFSDSAPTIVCAPLHVCEVQLQPGEVIEGAPHIGDAVRWKVAPAVSGSEEQRVVHLVMKPTEPGLDTNLIVPTDRRTYHLRLVSSSEHYVSSVAFEYPDDQQRAWQDLAKSSAPHSAAGAGANVANDMPTVAVNRLNFNYKIKVVKGKPAFKPLRAMDDGYHTYVAMNDEVPLGEAPVLIGVAANGDEQMINYRLKGNLYVVDGTIFKLALISGVGKNQERVELTRDVCKRRGWLGICWDAKE